MILISCALECEARPIIDCFKLKKTSLLDAFQIFKRDDIHLVITGVGSLKTTTAISACIVKLCETFKKDNFLLFNIGICGGSKSFKKGEVVFPHTILSSTSKRKFFQEIFVKHNFKLANLMTHEAPVTDPKQLSTDCVDMEAFSFFHAATTFLKTSQAYCLKIVSDDCSGGYRDKDEISEMIKKTMPEVQRFIIEMTALPVRTDVLDSRERDELKYIAEHLKLTEYQKLELSRLAVSYKIRKERALCGLRLFLEEVPKDKDESKRIFTNIQDVLNA